MRGRQPASTRESPSVRGTGGGTAGGRYAVRKVEHGEDYVHVRLTNPDAFEKIRTPDWAARAAQDIARGAEVRTGKLRGRDEWKVESVPFPRPIGERVAAEKALRIARETEG